MDERGLARFREIGCLVMKTDANDHMAKHLAHCDTLGIPYEDGPAEKILECLPIHDLKGYHPAKRPEDPGFGEPTGDLVTGGIFFPTAGYVTDPDLSSHNLQRATEAKGASFRI